MDSTSDERVRNNTYRHQYRVLSGREKTAMQDVKDMALKLHLYYERLGDTRELSLAKTRLEESIMWAVKHITR